MTGKHSMGWIAGVLFVLAMSDVAFAQYHAGVGRFLQRDPIGYHDGMNLYQFVGGNPVGRVDPFGLAWKIARDNTERQACAVGEKGDKISELAKLIGLNPAEAEKWIEPEVDGNYVIKGDDDCDYKIPNTVIAAWIGELEGFGSWWVGWGRDKAQIEAQGHFVEEWDIDDYFEVVTTVYSEYNIQSSYEPKAGVTAASMKADLVKLIADKSGSKELHGWLSWSHGSAKGGLHGPSMTGHAMAEDFYLPYSDIDDALEYGLAKALVHACYSSTGKASFLKGNPNGKYYGHKGAFMPWLPRDQVPWNDAFK